MNKLRKTWRRGHYEASAQHFLHLLGIEGDLVAVNYDALTGYVQVITTDDEGPEVYIGQHVEPKRIRIEQTLNDKDEVVAEAREWI